MKKRQSYFDEYLSGSAFDQEAQSLGVTDRLIRRLRVAILNGQLRPGQKVVEADLCQEFEVSRATLREALRLLEAERLIELVPNRGPFVAKLGISEIQEIHDVWAMLTGEAVRRFTARCEPDDLKTLGKTIERLAKAIAADNHVEQMSATNHFFNLILEKADNHILRELTINLVSRLMFLRAQSLLHHRWGHLYAQEIEAILQAMRERNAEAAHVAVIRHISSACAAAKQVSLMPNPKQRFGTRGKQTSQKKTAGLRAERPAKRAPAEQPSGNPGKARAERPAG